MFKEPVYRSVQIDLRDLHRIRSCCVSTVLIFQTRVRVICGSHLGKSCINKDGFGSDPMESLESNQKVSGSHLVEVLCKRDLSLKTAFKC